MEKQTTTSQINNKTSNSNKGTGDSGHPKLVSIGYAKLHVLFEVIVTLAHR